MTKWKNDEPGKEKECQGHSLEYSWCLWKTKEEMHPTHVLSYDKQSEL